VGRAAGFKWQLCAQAGCGMDQFGFSWTAEEKAWSLGTRLKAFNYL